MSRSKRVFVMLSGGVDSAVAALLLRDAGHQVTGVFMKNWSPDSLQSLADCPWQQDQADAAAVAERLQIPFLAVNFEREYRAGVLDYFLEQYAAGRTPNPDVRCNEAIKFGVFLTWAKAQGAEAVASGHYARLVTKKGIRLVARGRDPQKDQSYFLASVAAAVWPNVLLPLGSLTKQQTRRLAAAAQLPVATKKDSQGICFVGQLPLRDFLRHRLGEAPGPVVLTDGTEIGQHAGTHFFTIGQRHGFTITDRAAASRALKLPPTALPPLFVVGKEKRRLIVAPANAESLQNLELGLRSVHWHLPLTSQKMGGLKVQIRYRSPAVLVKAITTSKGVTRLMLRRPVRAAAPGQLAAFFSNDAVVGWGIIAV